MATVDIQDHYRKGPNFQIVCGMGIQPQFVQEEIIRETVITTQELLGPCTLENITNLRTPAHRLRGHSSGARKKNRRIPGSIKGKPSKRLVTGYHKKG